MNIAPVAIIAFNRPDLTAIILRRIREVKPKKLYVIIDAPRADISSDEKNCKKVKELVTKMIDWKCCLKINQATYNMGCKDRVKTGLDWVFEQEDSCIIIEDDCLADKTFFSYCTQLLYRYSETLNVFTINGDGGNYLHEGQESYYFSKFFHCWGWATWKRVWQNYNENDLNYQAIKGNKLYNDYAFTMEGRKHWRKKYLRAYNKEISSWATIFSYNMLEKKQGMHIHPNRNLIENIGQGHVSATHATSKKVKHLYQAYPMEFPLIHPNEIARNIKADRNIENERFREPTLFGRVYRKIISKLNGSEACT